MGQCILPTTLEQSYHSSFNHSWEVELENEAENYVCM